MAGVAAGELVGWATGGSAAPTSAGGELVTEPLPVIGAFSGRTGQAVPAASTSTQPRSPVIGSATTTVASGLSLTTAPATEHTSLCAPCALACNSQLAIRLSRPAHVTPISSIAKALMATTSDSATPTTTRTGSAEASRRPGSLPRGARTQPVSSTSHGAGKVPGAPENRTRTQVSSAHTTTAREEVSECTPPMSRRTAPDRHSCTNSAGVTVIPAPSPYRDPRRPPAVHRGSRSGRRRCDDRPGPHSIRRPQP